MKIILYLLLIIMAASLYFLVVSIRFKSKRFSLMGEVISPKQKKSKVRIYLENKGWLKYLLPSLIRQEARKYGWEMTSLQYWSTFVLGAAIGMVLFEAYFANIILMCFGIVGGFLLINFQVHNRKKEYKTDTEEKLGIYLRAVANTMGTFSNAFDAIKVVLPDLEGAIQSDVDIALTRMQQGSTVKNAFRDFVQKYSYNEIRLFHDILHEMNETGNGDIETLRTSANKFKKKKAYARKIQTVTSEYKKHVRTISLMVLSLPFLFMLQSFDNYVYFSNNIAGKIVMFLSVVLIVISFISGEKLSTYDVTEDRNIKM